MGTQEEMFNQTKEDTMNNRKWLAVGYLQTGEIVYQHTDGDFAKEMDYRYLVEMTDLELKSVLPERRDCE